jgi:hypothetical protein
MATFLQFENFNFETFLNGFSFIACIINFIFMAGVILHGFVRINFKSQAFKKKQIMKLIENYFDDLNYDPDFFLKENFFDLSLKKRIKARLTLNYHLLGFVKKTLTLVIIMYGNKIEN